MTRDEIEFVEYAPFTFTVPSATKFEYKPRAGWAWLQRLCFSFLRWRGCFSVEDRTDFKRHIINPGDLLERILRQDSSLLEFYHRRGERLLIGAETMAELMQQPRINQYMDFSAEYRHDRMICGLKITVVPHMRGLLVLPRLDG
jgi:hypothetical protein